MLVDCGGHVHIGVGIYAHGGPAPPSASSPYARQAVGRDVSQGWRAAGKPTLVDL